MCHRSCEVAARFNVGGIDMGDMTWGGVLESKTDEIHELKLENQKLKEQLKSIMDDLNELDFVQPYKVERTREFLKTLEDK